MAKINTIEKTQKELVGSIINSAELSMKSGKDLRSVYITTRNKIFKVVLSTKRRLSAIDQLIIILGKSLDGPNAKALAKAEKRLTSERPITSFKSNGSKIGFEMEEALMDVALKLGIPIKITGKDGDIQMDFLHNEKSR